MDNVNPLVGVKDPQQQQKRVGRPPANPIIRDLETVGQDQVGSIEQELPEISPITHEKVDAKTDKCPNHPKVRATLYGLCAVCYSKLPPMQKRKLFLEARLDGINAHNYPAEMIRTWKQELTFIGAGIWKAPLKVKNKSKLVSDLIG